MGACCSKPVDESHSTVAKERRRLSVSQVTAPVIHERTPQDESSNDKVEPIQVDKINKSEYLSSILNIPTNPSNVISKLSTSSPNHRLSFLGAPSPSNQREWDDKEVVMISTQEENNKSNNQTGLGFCCKKGLKPESPNQDDFIILKFDDWGLYGVFDGHGPFGHLVSSYVHQILPSFIISNTNFELNPKLSFSQSFKYSQNMIEKMDYKGVFDASLSGTTSTVVLLRNNKLIIGHVGDSRSVIARKSPASPSELIATDLSKDHKPDLPTEKSRVNSMGGQVKRLEGDVCFRVFVKGKMYPGLAMSRSLGDNIGQSVGVSCEADITELDITDNDSFVLICSDGIWEFISSQEAVDIIKPFPINQSKQAAEALASEAWKRWIKEEGNVVDDITVILLHIHELNK